MCLLRCVIYKMCLSGCATQFPTLRFCHFRVLNRNYTYEIPAGVHHYTISRSDFALFSEMKIYVMAENDLGQAFSASIILEPIGAGESLHKQNKLIALDRDNSQLVFGFILIIKMFIYAVLHCSEQYFISFTIPTVHGSHSVLLHLSQRTKRHFFRKKRNIQQSRWIRHYIFLYSVCCLNVGGKTGLKKLLFS